MDMNDVENVTFNALGGADTIHVHDLSGTDVKSVAIDLAGTSAAPPATVRPTRSPSTARTATT